MSYLGRLVEHIFGSDFLQPQENVDMTTELIIPAINTRLQSLSHTKDHVDHKSATTNKIDHGDGRIGNVHVRLGIPELANPMSTLDSLKIIGLSNFGTVQTNCGVFKGKWQYEVLLMTNGVMQIGWATSTSKFGAGQGVGDTEDSYAFDGNRVQKWNVFAENYGEKWVEDDIIGCCIDLDEGCIEFYRNGSSMGLAFKKIHLGAGIVYFPTLSLQKKEGLIANFGSTPFYYPVPEYRAIQEPPHDKIASATYLLDCMSKLLSLMDSHAVGSDPASEGLMCSQEAVLLDLGRVLILNATPLFSIPYVVEAKLIPFLKIICDSENGQAVQGHVRPSARVSIPKSNTLVHISRKMNSFLDLVWAFSERNKLKMWTSGLISSLSARFQHIMRPLVLEFSPQKEAILILHSLICHRNLRHYIMNHIVFEGVRLPWFMNLKVPSIQCNAFWETEPSLELNKRAYMATVNRISSAMSSLENMQVDLLVTMMDSSDGSPTEPSSRSIFLNKFRILRRQFYALYRVDPLLSPGSPLSLVGPLYLRLLHLVEVLWTRELEGTVPDAVSPTKFYDGSISYFDIDRLGGVLLYLLKTFHKDLEKRPGVSANPQVTQGHRSEGSQSLVESSTSPIRTVPGIVDLTHPLVGIFDSLEDLVNLESSTDQGPSASYSEHSHCFEEPRNSHDFLTELLDGVVLFYHITTKTQPLIQNWNACQERIHEVVESLNEVRDAIKSFHMSCTSKQQPEVLRTMETSYNVLLEHLHQTTTRLATLHAIKYTSRHLWFFKTIINTMKISAQDVHVFHFVPEFYFTSLVILLKELNHEENSNFTILNENLDRVQIMLDIVKFICDYVSDQRIRIARAKDILLVSLLDIVSTPKMVEILHNIPPESQMNMIRFLLQPYENRAWANSNWILVRIWHGSSKSFGCNSRWSMYRKYKLRPKSLSFPIRPLCFQSDPYPSTILQEQIQALLIENPELATSFVNSILNQLNWSFSEFIGMLQELQNVSNRHERILVESRQLKICATCFDLTLALLRVVEMVAALALPVFVRPDDPNSNSLLARLCQLLCQVLNRASSQDGCFHHIATLEIPGLENVDHLPIITAVCGILLAILKEEIENFLVSSNEAVPKVTMMLLMEPSFQISSFTFLLEENPRLYSLRYYKELISPEEIAMVEKMLTMLTHYHQTTGDINAGCSVVDEDDMCTICFAFPISARFEPCKHHSCQACITHHLLNCKNCFFCKAFIRKVVDNDGNILLDVDLANQVTNTGCNSG